MMFLLMIEDHNKFKGIDQFICMKLHCEENIIGSMGGSSFIVDSMFLFCSSKLKKEQLRLP